MKLIAKVGAVVSLFFIITSSQAANILFVADAQSDTNIPGVLTGDGHTVTTVLNDFDGGTGNNTALQGMLSSYDSIVWSATGTGSGDTHAAATFTQLTNYVTAGGTLLVVGYDTVASPDDPNLIAFLGWTSSDDTSGENVNGPVTGSNILSTGFRNIIGVTPTGGYNDSDTLEGATSGTCVVSRPNEDAGDCAWTVRSVGSGQATYISNGQLGVSAHASWENTSLGGAGAYNAALRNFAFNAGGAIIVPPQPSVPVPTMSVWGLILLSGALVLFARRRKLS